MRAARIAAQLLFIAGAALLEWQIFAWYKQGRWTELPSSLVWEHAAGPIPFLVIFGFRLNWLLEFSLPVTLVVLAGLIAGPTWWLQRRRERWLREQREAWEKRMARTF